jgi:UDP-4-amino-4,6-dideoxy-N-acetyl-beta-L-altrosamine N-acetyltransferase
MNEFVSDRVRPMAERDLVTVLDWRNHPQVRGYMYHRHEISLDEHRDWFARVSADPRHHALIVESADQPLGFVQFKPAGDGGIVDWGFYLTPGATKGSGRRLGRAALAYGFGTLGLHKVCGQALAFNERSIALHRALGFRDEGVLRDQHFDGGAYHAVFCFGLLSTEWSTLSGERT